MRSGSLRRFGGYLRTRWASPRRIRFWVLLLVILYTLLGFFVLPWVIQHLAINTAQEDYGRELRIESIHTNPYTLTLRVDGLELDDTDHQLLVGWERLSLDLAWSGLISRIWTLRAIHLHTPFVQEERFASGETRLSRLVAESTDPDSDADKRPPALQIDELRIEGGILRFADNLEDATGAANKPDGASLELQDIALSVEDFSLQEGSHSPVHLEGELAGGGMLAFNGSLQLLPTPELEGDAHIDSLALVQAEPYVRQFLNVRLDSGTLSVGGKLHSGAEQLFAFRGSAVIEALHVKDDSDDETLIGWQSFLVEKIDFDLSTKRFETGSISIDGLSGKVVIREDRTTNFSEIVAKSRGEAAEDDDAEKAPTPFDITIESIALTDGAIDFADHSLPLFFSTNIHDLSGEMSTLSSTSSEPAKVELQGQVEEDGLARLEGTIHAFQPTHETDLQLSFRNLQIPGYSPYTVRFAGRKIEEGTMDLDLNYTIKQKQLDGNNDLTLRDLKLGDEMDSSSAMDLPLNIAIALLKDSDGVIDLDLSVSGDVGDPEFDVGQIVRDALKSAITSIVEAPFRFLAELVGADSEDLGQIEFTEGDADLLPPQRARIDELRKALNQRPSLAIELAGPFSRTFDGPAVQRQKAIAVLRQQLIKAERDAEDPSLTTESNQDIVEAMFGAYYPDGDLDAVRAGSSDEKNASPDDADFDALAYRNRLSDKVIAAQTATDDELMEIANTRASVVRGALIDAKSDTNIAADRVRLLAPKEIDSVDGDRIVMEIGIHSD